jgi:chaperone required for assembly of F1-ATPase
MNWAARQFQSIWQTASGIEPAIQTQETHRGVRARLEALDSMRLAAACVMASVFSSLLLTIAVLAGEVSAEEAFELSRLEEEVQAEQWGRDAEAQARKARVKAEIQAVSRFLGLLPAAQKA